MYQKKFPAEDYRAKKDGDGLVDERLVLLQSQQEPRKVLLYISDIKEATNHQLAWRKRVVFDVVVVLLLLIYQDT